jgi:hypothetical protein
MPKGAKCPKYVSGNSLKGSNIKKEKKNPRGREKGCGRGRETTIFFYLAYNHSAAKILRTHVSNTLAMCSGIKPCRFLTLRGASFSNNK